MTRQTGSIAVGSRKGLIASRAQTLEATETLSFDRELLQAHDRAVELFAVIEAEGAGCSQHNPQPL